MSDDKRRWERPAREMPDTPENIAKAVRPPERDWDYLNEPR